MSTQTFSLNDTKLERVTVFRSFNAEINRSLSVDLKAGNNEITVKGLSSSIDPDTFRVSGLGGVQLQDLLCKNDSQKFSAAVEDPVNIKDAKKKIERLQTYRSARDQELEILSEYGKSMKGTSITPDQAFEFAGKLLEKRTALTEELQGLREEIADLQTAVKNANRFTSGSAGAGATFVLVAPQDVKAQLKLSYLVSNAGWHSTYDLQATSKGGEPSPSVWLQYRVYLTQTTGEHWDKTSVVLSTTDTNSLLAGIPEPPKLGIRSKVQRPATQIAARYADTRTAEELEESDDDMGFGLFDDGPDTTGIHAPIFEAAAAVGTSPVSVTYTVEGESTIPSDGDAHKVSVAQLNFDAKIDHVVVPRKEALAYLRCEVLNATDHHLLPGNVSVFMDGSYVSKTSIKDISPGDTFRCSLGVDTSTKVAHYITSFSQTTKASSFVEQYKTVTYTSTTTIHNRHSGTYTISVVEKSSVPVAPKDDNRIRVFLKEPSQLGVSEDGTVVDLSREDGFKVKWSGGDEKDRGGQKAGNFVWVGSVAPGKEVTLVSKWEVRAPVDVEWEEKVE